MVKKNTKKPSRKEEVIELINLKLTNKTFLSYKEIAAATGYHQKYVLKLRDEIVDGSISLVHGNKNRTPINAMGEEEKKYIIDLYKKSNVSIRKFCHFYNRRSYSCIYNLLKSNGLIK